MVKTSAPPPLKSSFAHLSHPPLLPILGHGLAFSQDPIAFVLDCAQNYGELVPLKFGHQQGLFLNSPRHIEEALIKKNRDFMRKGKTFRLVATPLLGKGLFLSEGEYYFRLRELSQPAFHKKIMGFYAQVMVEETQKLLNLWGNGGLRDIYQDYVRVTRDIVTRTLLGVEVKDEAGDAVNGALDATMADYRYQLDTLFLIPAWLPTAHKKRLNQAIAAMDEVVYDIIDRRRQSGETTEIMLDLLLQAQGESGNPISDQELRDEVVNLFLAGHETTAISLSWASWLLSQNPSVAAKLRQELNEVLAGRAPAMEDIPALRYTEAVALEVLRLYPPVWLLGRTALVDTDIDGYPIAPETSIFACPYTAHRDPQYFPDPEAFNPDRWLDGLAQRLPKGAYFPFSMGARLCLGKAFGMMELVLLLAMINQHFSFEAQPQYQPEMFACLTLRPKDGLPMLLKQA